MQDFLILHVEDEEDDVLFIQQAFKKAGITNPLKAVEDGQSAIDYLAGTGKYAERQQYPLPAMVLLDLNLPGQSGFDVLKWIRNHPELKRTIVVVICSSSQNLPDINAAYDLGANGYVVKPATFPGLVELAKAIRDYWLIFNQRPNQV